MVSEVALALVLLTGAGLLIRSFVRLSSVDPGFDPQHLLTERVVLPLGKYPEPARCTPFFQSVLERVGGLPGVESVAAASPSPLTDALLGGLEIEGRPTPRGVQISTVISAISPSFFHTLRIPLISGRNFTSHDDGSAPNVAIVNDIFARRYFGQADPLGHRIRILDGSWYSIVGVVPNTRYLPLTTEPSPEVFICDVQHPQWDMTLIVHATSDPASLAAAVRGKVHEVDPNQPVDHVATMEERFSQAVAPQRFNALVLVIFAGMAVILAGVGVYGVMAYSVTRRTHEIGVRMALGAQRQDVLQFVLRHGALLVASGIGLGVAGALALTRSLSSLLYGVKPTDPLTFIGVSLILISVALMASYIPARRATKVEPMVALRHE
jgi:putative ABC transport system permease protein